LPVRECERPLASACASNKKTWKKQTHTFSILIATADGSGPVAGMEAVKHWVQAWREF